MVSRADIVSVQRVDHVKVAPHEPIAAVHAIDAAAHDAWKRIESSPRIEAGKAQRFRLHAGRLEWNLVVAVSIIHPPGVIEHPPLPRQALIERRAWKRRQMIEGGDIHRIVARK